MIASGGGGNSSSRDGEEVLDDIRIKHRNCQQRLDHTEIRNAPLE